MLNDTFLSKATETRQISDGLNYFLLFLMFASIIISVVVVIYFAKWLTLGPKLKKTFSRKARNEMEHGVQLKGKEIIVDANYEDELRRLIKESHSPQEKLDYQSKLDQHVKQREKAEAEIKAAEEQKLAKIQEKEERQRIQQEAKEEAKKYKEEAAEAKQKAEEERLRDEAKKFLDNANVEETNEEGE